MVKSCIIITPKVYVMKLSESSKFKEVIRFGIVGIIATVIHYAVYFLLNFWLNASIAYSIGYVISFIGNFFLSNYFTFKTKPSTRKGLGFAFSHVINYILQIVFLNFFIWVGINERYAPVPTWSITIPVNFILVRRFLKNKYNNDEKKDR